jgi:hypothetical protein
LFGFVDRRNPWDVVLNRNADFKQAPHVLPHEYEHVLQNKVNARYAPKSNYDQTVVSEYNRINKGAPVRSSIIDSLQKSANNPAIPEYFQKTYGFPLKYFGNAKNFFGTEDGFDLKEQWAEISAAEQFLKKDLTKDPFVRKNVFNDDQKLIDVYKGTTGLRMERLDSKDLPPMTAQPTQPPGYLEKLMQMFGR